MTQNEPSASELDVSQRSSVVALYLRVATTLEQSAGLAEEHAARAARQGHDQLARVELGNAERARAAARRCRDFAGQRK